MKSRKGNRLVICNKKACLQWLSWGMSQLHHGSTEWRTYRMILFLLLYHCEFSLFVLQHLLSMKISDQEMTDHFCLARRCLSARWGRSWGRRCSGQRQLGVELTGGICWSISERRESWSLGTSMLLAHIITMAHEIDRSPQLYNPMEFGKVIPQASEALQHSLMMEIPQSQPKPAASSMTTLKQMARDVQNIISHFPYHRASLPPSLQPDNNNVLQPAPKQNALTIGKYNPIGQVYRYEKAQYSLQISPPQIEQKSKTEHNIEPPKRHDSELSVRDKYSVCAEESLDNEQLKFPSHNYYIMFDQKHKKSKQIQAKNNMNQTFNPSKASGLQKKVQKLQKQLQKMKGKTQSSGFHRSDGRMRLQKLLDSMIL